MKLIILLLVSCSCHLNFVFCNDVYTDYDDFMPGDGGKIVGGTKAQIINFPYQVSLRINGVHACGGAIVSIKYVVTAGHCVYG